MSALYKVAFEKIGDEIVYANELVNTNTVAYGSNYVLVRSNLEIGELVLDEDHAVLQARIDAANNSDALKSSLFDMLALIRYRKEISGTELNDLKLDTSLQSQARITSAFTSISNGFIESTRFKGVAGWMSVGLEQITAITLTVTQHVAHCFSAENQVVDALESMDYDELKAVNLQSLFDVAFSSITEGSEP